jgi:hypothetical protein
LNIATENGKMRMTDVADSGQLFRLIQSIPSPKSEPFKLWQAKVAANMELILNMLAEASTKDISAAVEPQNFEESKNVAQQGGNVARVALKEVESKTGTKVVLL